MKKKFVIPILFVLFSNSYAQDDSIRKPIECGTGRIMQMENERNQKIIQDFISASGRDPMFGSGKTGTIGKQSTDEDILKAGLKDYDWNHDNIQILKSTDRGNYRFILFSHQKDGKFPAKVMALYDKTYFMFRTYDPFYYKNDQHPEVLGKWIMSAGFSSKGNQEIQLEPAAEVLGILLYDLEIKDDYTFEMSDHRGDCPPPVIITGIYSFDAVEKITFYCNAIQYLFSQPPKQKPKPFASGPFKLTKENGTLILKK